MASAVSVEHIFSRNAIAMYDHDPGGTTAIIASPDGGTTKYSADMRDYEWFAALVKPSVLVGAGVTKLEIVAAENSTMTTNLTVVKDSGAVAADALTDYVALECNAQELAQLGANLRYVAARITMDNAGDEAVVVYIRSESRFPQTGLTATTIA